MASNKQLSTIEYLRINHFWKFNELSTLLSYTPQLRRLSFTDLHTSDMNIGGMLPTTLSNLTYLDIHISELTFDDFEIFIKNIHSKLKVLCVTIRSGDIAYLNVVRWEKLILEYLPQLKKINFVYYDCFERNKKPSKNVGQSNQFSSSFWIERRWIFEIIVFEDKIMYLIRPYKKSWYDYEQHEIVNSSIELAKSARLVLACSYLTEWLGFIADMNLVLTATDIYHLEITKRGICIFALINIMVLLPKLVSLNICSPSILQPLSVYNEEFNALLRISNRNQITKVYLEKMENIEQVFTLMKLCPRLNHLQVNFNDNIDVELFIKSILMKIQNDSDQNLRLLCVRVTAADDKMIIKLQKMIDVNKLLVDYKIKRVVDNIYVQWQ